MSNNPILWSKIGEKRGVHAASPDIEKKPSEPAPAQAGAPTKVGGSIVLKVPLKCSGANRSSSTSTESDLASSIARSTPTSPATPVTTMLWSDYPEDEPSQESLVARNATLHAKHLGNMESTVDHQSRHIDELNNEIKSQAARIVELESEEGDKNKFLEKLEAVVSEKDARIVALVRQVDEEAHRATQLEKVLEKKAAILQKLEMQVSDNVSMPGSDSLTEVEIEDRVQGSASPHIPPEISPAAVDPNGSDKAIMPAGRMAVTTEVTPEVPLRSLATVPVDASSQALSNTEYPALGTPAPVRDLRRSPFVTAANIKKMPPPPPAPTLKLGIDTSKYQKKPTAGTAKVFPGPRSATQSPPNIDTTKDIRTMSKEQRELFGYGPIIQIVMGTETVATLPKYVFMQVSKKAFRHWTDNPTAGEIEFEAGSMTKDALEIVLDWMTTQTRCKLVFSVALRNGNSDRHNLEIVRCARSLGLHPMYVSQFTRNYCDKVRGGPTKELVTLIEELAYNDDEPIFECLANYLAMERSKMKAEDFDAWEKDFARLPKLAKKIKDIQSLKSFASGKTWTTKKV